MFNSIEKISAVDACTASMRQAILSGELTAGELLPAERAMAESFGVNRVTVRAALDRLTTAGLLSRRQGSGYRVLDYRRSAGPQLIGSLAVVADSPGEIVADLLKMRRSLAQTLFETLEERLDEAGLRGIDEALEGFAAAVAEHGEDDPQAPASIGVVAAADMEMLLALLSASRSEVLQLCFNPILNVVAEMPALRRAMYADPAANLLAYRTLRGLLAARLRRPSPSDDAPWIDQALALIAARDALVLDRLETPRPTESTHAT